MLSGTELFHGSLLPPHQILRFSHGGYNAVHLCEPDKRDGKVRLHLLFSLRCSSICRGSFLSDRLLHKRRRNDSQRLLTACYVRFRHKSPFLFSDTEELSLHEVHYMRAHIFRKEHNGSYRAGSTDFLPADGILLYASLICLFSVRYTGSKSEVHSFRISDMWNSLPDVRSEAAPEPTF